MPAHELHLVFQDHVKSHSFNGLLLFLRRLPELSCCRSWLRGVLVVGIAAIQLRLVIHVEISSIDVGFTLRRGLFDLNDFVQKQSFVLSDFFLGGDEIHGIFGNVNGRSSRVRSLDHGSRSRWRRGNLQAGHFACVQQTDSNA
jgi:hypothetical protein